MITEQERQHINDMAKLLREQVGITELNLINFNDEFKRLLIKQINESGVSPKLITDLTELLNKIHPLYIEFKTALDAILALFISAKV